MSKLALVALGVGFLIPAVRLRLAASGTARSLAERFGVGASKSVEPVESGESSDLSKSKRGRSGEGGIVAFGKRVAGVEGAGSAPPIGGGVAGLLELFMLVFSVLDVEQEEYSLHDW